MSTVGRRAGVHAPADRLPGRATRTGGGRGQRASTISGRGRRWTGRCTRRDLGAPGTPRSGRPLGAARGVLKTMRPRQWVKNVLVSPRRSSAATCSRRASSRSWCSPSWRSRWRRRGDLPGQRREGRRRRTARTPPSGSGRSPPGVVAAPAGVAVAVVLLAARRRRSACSRRCSWRSCWASTSRCSWRTASGSSTSRCSTSASWPRASCCARSPAVRPPASRSRSGSCWWRASGRCSWSPASGTPR